MWIQIDKSLIVSEDNAIVGIVYIPPENSRFLDEDEYDMFNDEIIDMCGLYNCIFLTGDMNARTSSLDDFITYDPFIIDFFDFDEDLIEFCNQPNEIELQGISLERTSMDTCTNNNGRKLLEICKNNNLFIINGRFGQDKDKGIYTFRNKSVIDYTLTTSKGFSVLTDFKVLETDCLFSDGHCLLSWGIKRKAITISDTEQTINTSKIKWKPQEKDKFIHEIDLIAVDNLKAEIGNAKHNLSIDSLNKITDEISQIFLNSALKAFPQSNYKAIPMRKKPWFGFTCSSARKSYHQAKKQHQRQRNQNTKRKLNRTSKEYKKTLNKFISKHKKENRKKLRHLHCNKPKEYWKILNSVQKKTKPNEIDINEFYDYFKNLNAAESENGDIDFIDEIKDFDINDDDEILNNEITVEEIKKAIKNLKNNKSPGSDGIINEYIKSTEHIMIPLYLELFNLILDTGIIPDTWLEGIIKPIYKHNGDVNNPGNYRPITLLSCLGKLFSAILNSRFTKYVEHQEILSENQAGFRQGYSTADHSFVLFSLIEILKSRGKKLFCCFVDFTKAFDSVWRAGLWKKLLFNNINGKFFKLIYNMYQNIKSCVRNNDEMSAFFVCSRGVRQGESLSPLLFSMYLNDLEQYLQSRDCEGISLDYLDTDLSFYMYIKFLILLYADDAVILSDDPENFQYNINVFHEFCTTWKLDINLSKTKVIVFGARNTSKFSFHLGDNKIEFTDKYKYLGVFFAKSTSFLHTRKHVVSQAKKALHLLYRRVQNIDLPFDLQLKLFDNTILPILTYGSELWGFENLQIIERVQNEFLRRILKLRKSTPLYMLYGELGRYPVELTIFTRMLTFWGKLITGKQSKLSFLVYQVLHRNTQLNIGNHKWITCIRSLLQNLGRNDIWLSQTIDDMALFKKHITTTLSDQYIQKWSGLQEASSKGRTYRIFKAKIDLESYLISLSPNISLLISKLRTSNLKLPVETGRWNQIPLSDRKCTLCNMNDIGDEFHYLLKCDFFENERELLIPTYCFRRPNIPKFEQLLNSKKTKVLINLSKFVSILIKQFK